MENKTKPSCRQCEQKIKQLQDEVVKYQQEMLAWKDKYLRALADYQNFEKRVNNDKDELRKTANQFFIMRLLPFLDNLERAETFVKNKNLQVVKEEFVKLLHQEGIEEVVVLGKEFDPYLAEAIDVVSGEKDNIVIEVVRKGYKFQGRLIRPAQVKVSKKLEVKNLNKSHSEQSEESDQVISN